MKFPALKNTFARQFSYSLLTKIFMIVLRMARNAILARVLGPADRGVFSLLSSLPEMVMTAGNCGVANAAAYYAANDPGRRRRLFENINSTLFFMAVVLFGASLLWVQQTWLVKGDVQTILAYKWYVAAGTVLVLYKAVNYNLLNVLNLVAQVNFFSLLESLLPLVLFLVFWLAFAVTPILAAVYSWFLSLAVVALLSSYGRGHFLTMRIDAPVQRDLFSYGSRSYFDSLFLKLLLRLDFLFVSAMVGAEGLGYYAMATAAAELLLIVPNSLAIPLFSFLLKTGIKEKNATIATLLRLLFAGMIVLALLFWVFGKLLILVFFGKDYLPAYLPMVLLLPGLVGLSFVTPIRLALLGENRPGAVSIIGGLSLVMDVVLNYLLIPSWGIEGAAFAATVSYVFGAIALSLLFLRLFDLRPRDVLLVRIADIKEVLRLVQGERK